MIEEKNKLSALVLEGGGAKGAYQLGALLALEAAGQRFDVVTGSSVGALNGLLVTTDQLRIGLDYWWNMSFGKVLTFRILGIIRLILEPIYLVGKLFGKGLGELADPMEGIFRVLFLGAIGVVLVGFFALIELLLRMIFHFQRDADLPFIAVLLLIMLVVIGIPYLLIAVNLSLFRPSPLRKLIKQVVQAKQTSPLIVTLTETVQRLDPDYPHFVGRPVAYGVNELEVISGPTRIPRYFPVSELPTSAVCDALLASAALPEGIFPAVRIDGTSYIDGGVSDNLPLYSALSAARIHDLVVIRLNPGTEAELKDHWQRSERLQRIRTLPVEVGSQLRRNAWPGPERGLKFVPPRCLPFVQPPYWPECVVMIAPESSLGNFLSGTLNFRRTKARELIRLGWLDAKRCLGSPASLPDEPPLPRSTSAGIS